MGIRAASDVGGTFTDLVYFETDDVTGAVQRIGSAKVHTTPPDFERGVLDSLRAGALDLAALSYFAHGSTVIINALTERKGAKTALLTTAGFRDVLEIARGNRPDFFNLRYEKPAPFVPRHLRGEALERIDYQGKVLTPLDTASVDTALAHFRKEGVEAIALCLLHAYANPAHELQLAAYIETVWPEVAVVASHTLTREWREYERTSSAVLSASVRPVAERYLGALETALGAQGFAGNFYVMRSNGGVDTARAIKGNPIAAIESGPASGVLGAAALGEQLGYGNLIAFDVGGTTAKCSLIEDGQVSVVNQYDIERDARSAGYPIMTPVVDLVEIGNGGGSIAWVDDYRKLHVGPQSAGALPGPVAYGKGGAAPTTTDANLLLGRINPEYFIGGEIEPDMDAVRAAFTRLGEPLGLDAQATASGVLRIANHNMSNTLKLVSINRGHDPREFAMVAFGGGGALHAAALARDLNIGRVIVPAHCAVFSAWGMLMSDLRRDYVRTEPTALTADLGPALEDRFAELEQTARSEFAADGIKAGDVATARAVDVRYSGQEHSVRVPVPAGALDAAACTALIDRFGERYEKEYTYRLEQGVEIVNYHLIATVHLARPEPTPLATASDLAAARKPSRTVDFDEAGLLDADIWNRDMLASGDCLAGPAVIEESGSTTVLYPGQQVEVDAFGNLHITAAP